MKLSQGPYALLVMVVMIGCKPSGAPEPKTKPAAPEIRALVAPQKIETGTANGMSVDVDSFGGSLLYRWSTSSSCRVEIKTPTRASTEIVVPHECTARSLTIQVSVKGEGGSSSRSALIELERPASPPPSAPAPTTKQTDESTPPAGTDPTLCPKPPTNLDLDGFTITKPAPDAKVLHNPEVAGTGDPIPPGWKLWLVTVPNMEGPLHPQNKGFVPVAGKWLQRPYVGASPTQDVGVPFELRLYLLDKKGNSHFLSYLRTAASGGWKGLPEEGMTEQGGHFCHLATVQVTRK